jgi:tetratricopeptide (TPR) repeat protein
MSSRQYSKFVASLDVKSSLPATAPGPVFAPAVVAELALALETARADYIAHRHGAVAAQIATLEERIAAALEAPVNFEHVGNLHLVRAALQVLKARSLAGRRSAEARQYFQQSAALFRQYPPGTTAPWASTRLNTDYAIALFRLGQREEAVALLEEVCHNGAAPADAFTYLGYARMDARDWQAADEALRRSLECSPAQPTVLYQLARSLHNRGRNPEAEEMYCRAGDYALSVHDYRTATLCGARALRAVPSSEAGLQLVVAGCRNRGRGRLALAVVERFLAHRKSWTVLALKGVLLREHCILANPSKCCAPSLPTRRGSSGWRRNCSRASSSGSRPAPRRSSRPPKRSSNAPPAIPARFAPRAALSSPLTVRRTPSSASKPHCGVPPKTSPPC